MHKDFDQWNQKKKQIHQQKPAVFFHEREVWWCSLGVNVGFEQDGSGNEFRRPVLILKGFSRQTCFIIPLTTSTHDHPLRPLVGLINGETAKALLSQMKVIDTKRLVRKIGYIDQNIFTRIQKAVKELL